MDPIGEFLPTGPRKYKIVRHIPSVTGSASRTLCGRDIPAEARYTKRRMQQARLSGDCDVCQLRAADIARSSS